MKNFLLLSFCLITIFLKAQTWQNVTPNPDNFPYITDIIDSTHMFGIYSNYVKYSSDGGLTWNTTDLGRNLWDADFTSIQNGWVLGDSGRLFHTNDACSTWDTLMLPTNQSYQCNFFDDTSGYVYNSMSVDTFYKTIDGGQNWIQIVTGLQYYAGLFFCNPTTVWALIHGDSIIYKTTNSGLSWDSVNLPRPYYSPRIQLIDSATAWIAGQGSNDSLLLTTDGGITWSERSRINTYEFCFKDTLNGIYQYSGRDYFTNDGGYNWTLVDSIEGRCWFAQNTFFIIGRGAIKSNDGIIWTQFYHNEFPNIYTAFIFIYPQLIFLNASTGVYITGDEGAGMAFFTNYTFITKDSGKHWTENYNLFPRCSHLQMISDSLWYFTIRSNGSSGSGLYLYKSTDQLSTISLINDTVGPTFHFTDSLHGVTGGNYTNDGGNTWIPNGPNNFGLDYSFIDTQNGWTVSGGSVSRTYDGGITWMHVGNYVSNNSVVVRIHFIDSLHGFLETYSHAFTHPLLLKTSDGGISFQDITPNFNFKSACFIDSLHGWIASDQGIYNTSDGGNSYFLQSNKRVEMITFYDSVNAYAEGSGLFMKSDQTGIINSIPNSFVKENELTIFPNPTSGTLNVLIPANNSVFSLYDSMGKLIRREAVSKGNFTIVISDYTSGMYLVNISSENNQFKKILIKE